MGERLEAVVCNQSFNRIEQTAARVVTTSALGTSGRGRTNGTKGVVEGHGRESPLGECNERSAHRTGAARYTEADG